MAAPRHRDTAIMERQRSYIALRLYCRCRFRICKRSICRNHQLSISSPYIPDTCRYIEIRKKQYNRPHYQQRWTTGVRTGKTIQNYLRQRRNQSETKMEIPVRSYHATRSGDDVLLVQTGMPIQRHDSSTAKLFHTGRAMVSRRIKRITPK